MDNLPCWLTPQDKYVIKNLIHNDDFSHFQNHQSKESEEDYYWVWNKKSVCGYKIIIEYDSCFLVCIINGCALNHYLGDFDNQEDEPRHLKAKIAKTEKNIKAYVNQFNQTNLNQKQLTLNLAIT